MPRPIINLLPSARETKDIHAPWWSAAKDASSGRYLERCVIFAQYLQADEQAIQAEVMSGIKLDMGAAAAAVAQGRDPKETLAELQIDLSGGERAGELRFARFVVELTDETGAPQPIGAPGFLGLEPRDADYILEQIEALKVAAVRPTALDAEIAAHNGTAAEAVAQDHFRGRGAAALSRR